MQTFKIILESIVLVFFITSLLNALMWIQKEVGEWLSGKMTLEIPKTKTFTPAVLFGIFWLIHNLL